MKQLRYSEQQITGDDIEAVSDVLRSDWITQGPRVKDFETALCEYTQAKHAVCVSNGTVALELAYRASGFRRIVTSPLTFMATANAALVAGMDVAFQDVDKDTGNASLYPAFADPMVFVPVHYAGRAAPLPNLERDGTPRGCVIIEDACHALGATQHSGQGKVGCCDKSLAAVFSFHAVKPITTAEGGAILSNDEGFAREVRSLRDHGREDGLMVRLGTNARMSELQAALGLSQLKRLDEMRATRRQLAIEYTARLLHYRIPVTLPWALSDDTGSWHLYPIRIGRGKRDEVKAKLNAQGIGAQVHYSPIVPLHPYYRQRFGYEPGGWPQAEAWAAEELSLPLHAGMSEADVVRVVEALKEAMA